MTLGDLILKYYGDAPISYLPGIDYTPLAKTSCIDISSDDINLAMDILRLRRLKNYLH